MTSTNYISSIVKILEIPKQKFLENKIPFTKFRVQLPQVRGSKIIDLMFWGNLSRDVIQYYTINDYIIVEGYVALKDKKTSKYRNLTSKKVEISVLRIYPFFLSSTNSNIDT